MLEKKIYQFIFAVILVYSVSFFIAIENVFGDSEAAYLKVIVLVNNTEGGSAQPSDFEVRIDGDAIPYYFPGSMKGTLSLVAPGTHEVTISNIIVNNVPYSLEFSGNCIGKGLKTSEVGIKLGDKKTCIITANYPNFE